MRELEIIREERTRECSEWKVMERERERKREREREGGKE